MCEAYPEIPACSGKVVSCFACHSAPPTLNPYGDSVAAALYSDSEYTFDNYVERLPQALAAVEAEDADGDGLTNLEELELGLAPGNPLSHWVAPAPPEGEQNTFYDVGNYDPAFALKRVMITYCGRPPTFSEVSEVRDAADSAAHLDTKLDACLASDYWLEEGLLRLADSRVKPLKAIGFDGLIPLADYAWDYRLFRHIMSGDRDTRDLLTATYHVDEDGERIDGPVRFGNSIYPPGAPLPVGGQPLDPEHRAGMITTQWFLMSQTMFSHLPRTTAAQAYRAYLGADIARSEGLLPVAGEPLDVDNKGVAAPACARCHSTLDPLAYAFATYDGIGGGYNNYGGGSIFSALVDTGAYIPERNPWGETSMLLDTEVANLTEWAAVAADSDMFKRNVARMFWEQAFQRSPLPDEEEDFKALWAALPEDGYRAEALLHRLIHVPAFGTP